MDWTEEVRNALPSLSLLLSLRQLSDTFFGMRIIGHIENETAARYFGDFLYVRGLPNTIEQDQGSWAVWVHDENDLENAGEWLGKFRANPSGQEFSTAGNAAGKREQEKKELTAFQKRIHGRREWVRKLGASGVGPLTVLLMVISIVVAVISKWGHNVGPIMALFITNWDGNGTFVQGLPEIRHGEVWRFFTPMFIHFGPMHIFFNMLWLRDLGSMIESRESTWKLLFLVLLTAGGSNLAQYSISIPSIPWLGGGSPDFGGMSGVVYGLFGYIWMRGKFDPASGLQLHKSTVSMMLVWLVLCMTGLLGPIANLAHLFGLLIGMGSGYSVSRLRSR